MTAQSGPYLREDLTVGRETRVYIESSWTSSASSVRRLLATVDELYVLLDERNAAMEAWRNSAGVSNLQNVELRRENAALKSLQHAALAEDVQAIREEAAACKDEYAAMVRLAKSLQVQVDNQMSVIGKILASRKKWKKRARRSDAVVRNQVEIIQELQERHAEDVSDLKLETIRLTAEDFADWLRGEKILRPEHGSDKTLVAEYLRGDVAVTEINEAKRELS